MSALLSYSHGTGTTPLLGDTIGADLDRAVAAWPDREALVDVPSGRRWTYAEFGAAVDAVAHGMLAKGVTKGDRVGIWAVNCPEWVLVQYATARIGAVMVNINPRLPHPRGRLRPAAGRRLPARRLPPPPDE
ncbi:acyl-CoA synthetase (AMP-forming)/AMP-acid ligase II [Streptomyces calvus]